LFILQRERLSVRSVRRRECDESYGETMEGGHELSKLAEGNELPDSRRGQYRYVSFLLFAIRFGTNLCKSTGLTVMVKFVDSVNGCSIILRAWM